MASSACACFGAIRNRSMALAVERMAISERAVKFGTALPARGEGFDRGPCGSFSLGRLPRYDCSAAAHPRPWIARRHRPSASGVPACKEGPCAQRACQRGVRHCRGAYEDSAPLLRARRATGVSSGSVALLAPFRNSPRGISVQWARGSPHRGDGGAHEKDAALAGGPWCSLRRSCARGASR